MYVTFLFSKFANLNIYYQNVRGLRTKTHVFYRNISCSSYDVIILTETNLNSSVNSSELFDSRYQVYRRDREMTGFRGFNDGGGVLIAVSRNLNSRRMVNWESSCEDLWVTIEGPFDLATHLSLCAVYLRSPISKPILEHFLNNCNAVSENHDFKTCIIGDFNLSCIDWNQVNNSTLLYHTSPLGHQVIDFANMNGLKQVNGIVNKTSRVLDLVLTDVQFCNVSESQNVISVIDTYHPPLDITLSNNFGGNRLKINNLNWRFNYFKANYLDINEELSNFNWDILFSDCIHVDDMLSIFYDHIYKIINKFVPKINFNRNRTKYPAWFNKNLIKLLREKNKYRTLYKKYNNPMDNLTFKLLRTNCEKLANKCYNAYIQLAEEKINVNPKYFWSFVKSKRGGHSTYPDTITNGTDVSAVGDEICNLFATHFSLVYQDIGSNSQTPFSEYWQRINMSSAGTTSIYVTRDVVFNKLKKLDVNKSAGPDSISAVFFANCADGLAYPLQLIFNRSLSTGTFPCSWKSAQVVPIFKSGDEANVNNYRPISLLSVPAKLFESIVYPIISNHFKQFLSTHQHGFVKARSTCSNLVSFAESVVDTIDRGSQIDVIYTDFSKAFDRVSHNVLLKKLSVYGFGGTMFQWICSYLKDRSFYVVVNGYKSNTFSIASGVPQGSHLGPLLFNIFINDISECFCCSIPYLYADDLKFSRVIESPADVCLLQSDVDRLQEWCSDNLMNLNIKKCLHIKFSRNLNIIPSSYKIDEQLLEEVNCIRDLGVLLDAKLTFVPHMENIIGRSSKVLGFVIRNGKVFRSPATKILLYNSLVRSILEYSSPVWRPHYAIHTLRLERVQKRFLWHLVYSEGLARKLKSYSDRLFFFKMLPLAKRMDLLDMMFLYKILRSYIDCPQLLAKFNLRVPSRYPRYAITPLAPPFRRTVLGFNSCVPRLCRLYNQHSGSSDIFSDSLYRFRRSILSKL